MISGNIDASEPIDVIRSALSSFSSRLIGPNEDSSILVQGEEKKESALDRVASTGLAGVLAIAAAESIFWLAGIPLAVVWVRLTTGKNTLAASVCALISIMQEVYQPATV